MKEPQAAESGEDRLIARYFNRSPPIPEPSACSMMPRQSRRHPGCDLVLKTDGVVAGMHFFPDDPPDTVARKALRVNLSDLAAKGASPLVFLPTARTSSVST